MRDLLALALTFVWTSMFAIGGASALLPELHRQSVDVHHWMSEAEFARSVALAQVAPGPNMLIVSLIGFRVAGLAGLAVSTLAILALPSVLAFAVGRWLERLKHAAWLALVKASLAPVVVGLMLAAGLVTTLAADRAWLSFVITAAAAAFMVFAKRNPLWIILAGALMAVAGRRLGLITIV